MSSVNGTAVVPSCECATQACPNCLSFPFFMYIHSRCRREESRGKNNVVPALHARVVRLRSYVSTLCLDVFFTPGANRTLPFLRFGLLFRVVRILDRRFRMSAVNASDFIRASTCFSSSAIALRCRSCRSFICARCFCTTRFATVMGRSSRLTFVVPLAAKIVLRRGERGILSGCVSDYPYR